MSGSPMGSAELEGMAVRRLTKQNLPEKIDRRCRIV
jgi:hypothetical protein